MQALLNTLSRVAANQPRKYGLVWASLYRVSAAFYTSTTSVSMQLLSSRLADRFPRLSTPLRGNKPLGGVSDEHTIYPTPMRILREVTWLLQPVLRLA